ncbi:MAG: FAD-dependent oxidoreductase, partial [Deltaproteobacteria bacterium]|nr:FAD-dependent oxidoreductase [Deltaproteobacteria bacterium]
TAPCSDACPLSLCIEGYVKNIAAGNFEDALKHVLAGTALPETVCRVCHRPCEDVCVTRDTTGPIPINELKRFVVTWAAEREQKKEPKRESREARGGDQEPSAESAAPHVAVVGAGPSGLTAASELRARGYDVTLFDRAERPGGLLASVLPAYRLPTDAIERDVARILSSGVVFRGGQTLGRDFTLGGLLADDYEAVYLAIGAHRSRSLDLPPAKSARPPELVAALPFLTSARSEPRRALAGPVLVIGGGDAAIDSARTALRLGADAVTIACLESRAEMPALPDQVALAEAEGISIVTEVAPLRLDDQAVAMKAVGGDSGDEVRIGAHLVISAIGQVPELTCLADDEIALEKTADGLLAVDAETGQTSHPQVFAGGDVVPGHRTVTEAMGSARRAAWAIDRSVRGVDVANERRPPPLPRRGEPNPAPRHSAPERRQVTEGRVFSDSDVALTEAEARAEAERCLACGLCGNCRACLDVFGCPALQPGAERVHIDASMCNGCNVCADMCPNNAISRNGP